MPQDEQEYTATWSVSVYASNPYHALSQVVAFFDDMVKHEWSEGPTLFAIQDENQNANLLDAVAIFDHDMLGSGFCDECNKPYVAAGNDHCGEEGLCWDHCTDKEGHDPYNRYLKDQENKSE